MADPWYYGLFVDRYKPLTFLAVLVTLCATAVLLVCGLKSDYRLEAFVASDDDSYARYRAFMEEFTSNEFALVAVTSPEVFGPAAEAVAEEIAGSLRKLPAVQRCGSLADLPPWLRAAMGERLLRHPLIEGNLISADHRTTALLCQMSGEAVGGVERRETVAAMKSAVARVRAAHPDFKIILTGPYVTLIDMYAYVDRDLLVFSVLALVLTVVTMWGVFGRWQPMAYAGAVAAGAILCTLGLTVALGIVTSLITQMIVILVIVLAVANCVHLAVAAEDSLAVKPGDSRSATADTLRRMWAPCVAVMLTTMVGFGSVCVSRIAPVRRFGALMAFGLFLALIFSFVGLRWIHRGKGRSGGERPWLAGLLDTCASVAIHRSRGCLVVFAVAVGFIAWGTTRLRFESDFVKNFRANSEVRRSYRFIEQHLTPLGSMELVVRRRSGQSVATADAVRAAFETGERVTERFPMVRKALTLADPLSLLWPGIPGSDAEVTARLAPLRATETGRRMLRNFLNARGDAMRINLRCIEGFGVHQKLRAAREIRDLAARRFGHEYEVEVTGLYYFYAKLVADLLRDQYRALGLTVVAIFVVMWLMLRSLKITVIAMVVNLLPVVVCLGTMGWVRVPVNMTTAMMLSVTMGIAVDDTLHYLWRLRREREACGTMAEAIRRAHAGVGRACVFTTVVIAGGFSILLLSQFLPTAYFGGLVGFTMLTALAADLILLPALIVLFKSFRSRAD